MNQLSHTIVQAVVQGICEVLPISSSAHLIILSIIFGFIDTDKGLIVFLHFGSFLSLAYYYRKFIYQQTKNLLVELWTREPSSACQLVKIVSIAILPTIIAGFCITVNFLRLQYVVALVTGFALVIGGVIMCLLYRTCLRRECHNSSQDNIDLSELSRLSVKQALIIGLLQLFALIPGVSRLGSSMVASILVGLPIRTAVHFSFIISLPILFGACFLLLIQGKMNHLFVDNFSLILSLTSMLVTVIVTFFVLRIFLHLLGCRSLLIFGVYRIVVGLLLYGTPTMGKLYTTVSTIVISLLRVLNIIMR